MSTATDSPDRRFTVISADTHGGAHPSAYREYLDAEFRDDFDDWLANVYPQVEKGFAAAVGQAMEVWGVDEDGSTHLDAFYAPMDYGITADPTARVEALEKDGIVASLIYSVANSLCEPPFLGGADLDDFFGTTARTYSREHQLAGLRAYNRWLADFCGAHPERLKGTFHEMDYADLDQAIGLIEEHAEQLRGGIMLPPLVVGRPGLHEPHWDRLWSVCEHYDLPVNTHAGFMVDPRIFGTGDASFNTRLVVATMDTLNNLPLALFMLGGVFDRHPSLKLVLSEQYADWIPPLLQRMQERVAEGFGLDEFRNLRHDLQTYWDRNCSVCATFMTRREARMRHEIGLETIMWGSDFPHPEGTYPHTRESLRLAFSEVPAEELALILGGNAARIYGFDLEALRPIADRVGPTARELAEPLEALPDGFRRFSMRPGEDRDLSPDQLRRPDA